MVSPCASSFIFDRIIIKVAGNRHKSSDGFDFRPLVSMAHLYVFWNERMSSSACGWSKDLFFNTCLTGQVWCSCKYFSKAFRFHQFQIGYWTRTFELGTLDSGERSLPFGLLVLAHLSRRLIGELIVRQASIVRPSSSVNIFKRHLLWSHEADSYQISHIASVGRGNE